ncbi:Dual specificity phosphatase, catalytic domain containing protein [Sporothrix schenckii 1099-18]|uniref:Dual specificity phosphatase, catalytic domain containing protein n=1 Tax=Sporothrix schenckii 1099-18 TaxID=1397361 RepID=A0A0F2MGV0_SPOSC|nr:Dual specificity phosphatase, catalytic domain containing protein [Sporothrix schenckii 1099-18]KJR87391.1 Dual specificity phosphatase, catalytic domain containing protein [Sporothrix schenckii 1099-18]
MATIALTRPMPPHRASSSMPPLSSSINIDVDTLNGQAAQPNPLPAGPVPNKHIPVCPPGPPVVSTTPSPSPPPDESSPSQQSLLFPPDHYPRFEDDGLAIHDIDPAGVAAAVDYIARQPLPDPSLVFPWFHGLHPVNHMQQAFFSQRRRVMRKTPCCLRGLTIVKADGQLQVARLKGAIAPGEFLQPGTAAEFLDPDPKEGFSVRNFQIQAAKTAMTSDIIVYGDDSAAVRKLAWRIAAAQKTWRDKHDIEGIALPRYNTFACTGDFSVFEEFYPHIVSADSEGHITGNVIDFFHQERSEMYAMTVASEISQNVWLGPTPEPNSEEETSYDVLIECSDLGHLNPRALRALAETGIPSGKRIHLDFPSSGTILPPTWSQIEADAILESCKWIYHLAHGTANPSLFVALTDVSNAPVDDGHDITLADEAEELPAIAASQPKKILIHCADGYTESSMLGLAYFSYSTGRPIHDAWLNLHTTKKRNFFAYPTDVALLTALSSRLLCESPLCAETDLDSITASLQNQPKWFSALDGSFPSRVLDYMYLGNLNHANNPDLLKALGITQILSVGEMAMWRDDVLEAWGEENVCVVQGVQDNGIDPLTDEFDRCLEFIQQGHRKGTATLVHCRVGVSRSATICIAEVMRSMKLSLPRAYCFVRARRLNVIIQPHLRFAYELLKWEEMLRQNQMIGDSTANSCKAGIRRELEWGEIAREVALMNQPYVR